MVRLIQDVKIEIVNIGAGVIFACISKKVLNKLETALVKIDLVDFRKDNLLDVEFMGRDLFLQCYDDGESLHIALMNKFDQSIGLETPHHSIRDCYLEAV
jgi:hypothetical protein